MFFRVLSLIIGQLKDRLNPVTSCTENIYMMLVYLTRLISTLLTDIFNSKRTDQLVQIFLSFGAMSFLLLALRNGPLRLIFHTIY